MIDSLYRILELNHEKMQFLSALYYGNRSFGSIQKKILLQRFSLKKITFEIFSGSSHCWDQAIYPVIPFEDSNKNDIIQVSFELKEHFKLKSCKNISKKNVDRETYRKTELFLPRNFLQFLILRNNLSSG